MTSTSTTPSARGADPKTTNLEDLPSALRERLLALRPGAIVDVIGDAGGATRHQVQSLASNPGSKHAVVWVRGIFHPCALAQLRPVDVPAISRADGLAMIVDHPGFFEMSRVPGIEHLRIGIELSANGGVTWFNGKTTDEAITLTLPWVVPSTVGGAA